MQEKDNVQTSISIRGKNKNLLFHFSRKIAQLWNLDLCCGDTNLFGIYHLEEKNKTCRL